MSKSWLLSALKKTKAGWLLASKTLRMWLCSFLNSDQIFLITNIFSCQCFNFSAVQGQSVYNARNSFPGPFEKSEKRAWYPLLAHALHKAHFKIIHRCVKWQHISCGHELWCVHISAFVLYGLRGERCSPSPLPKPSNPSAYRLNCAFDSEWSVHDKC